MPSSSLTSPVDRKFIGAVEDHWELFSDNSSDYEIGSPIGVGASSIVYAAVYRPMSEPTKRLPCALKVLDLDSLPPRSLSLLQRETTLMSLSKHPNVLRVRGSWMDGHKLYIALRLMNKGSAADVMAYGWPSGMEEEVVRCILSQALQGLNYLHINGFIHRDVKAANLLIDDDGTVLLGDLGVAADLSEDQHVGSGTKPHRISSAAAVKQPTASFSVHQSSTDDTPHLSHSRTESGTSMPIRVLPPMRPNIGKRKSFVGTPCWMAPELIQGKQYDSSADIWSFGITALELAHGRPPRSRETPQRVLLRIIQEAPPTLDREGGTFKYSKAFEEMIESCLVKNPSKRPTAEQLLASSFFKGAKKKSYLINTILKDLPPLAQRQQRRPVPTAQNRTSIDSWDFATTIHSTLSHNLNPGCLRKMTGSDNAEVFEMEADCECEQQGTCAVCQERHLRTTISWKKHELQIVDEALIASPSSTQETPDESSLESPMPSSGLSANGVKFKPSMQSLNGESSPSSTSVSASSRLSSSGLWKKIKTAAKRTSGTKQQK